MEIEMGNTYTSLIGEVSTFIGNKLDSSNILSKSANSFFVIFPGLDHDKAKKRIESLTKELKTLLVDNISNYQIEIISEVIEIRQNSEQQTLMNDLRSSVIQ